MINSIVSVSASFNNCGDYNTNEVYKKNLRQQYQYVFLNPHLKTYSVFLGELKVWWASIMLTNVTEYVLMMEDFNLTTKNNTHSGEGDGDQKVEDSQIIMYLAIGM